MGITRRQFIQGGIAIVGIPSALAAGAYAAMLRAERERLKLKEAKSELNRTQEGQKPPSRER